MKNKSESYPFVMYFGSPGCGKTTFAVRALLRHHGPRFCNFDTAGLDAQLLDDFSLSGLGKSFRLPDRSILCLDEVGGSSLFNNRRFKDFPIHLTKYFKLHRHFRNSVFLFSQSWDEELVDLRRLVTALYYVRKVGPFSIARKVKKEVCIDEQSQQIIDGYKFYHWWQKDGLQIIYRPRYYRFFDSFGDVPDLPLYDPDSSSDSL